MMKSFFRKVSSDAVSFKGKSKRHKFNKHEQDQTGPQNKGLPGNGSNFWIENCPNFHLGNTYNVITTNVVTTEEGVHTSKNKGPMSSKIIPTIVKENFSNILEATIEHFELVSSKINDPRSLGKELGLSLDQFQYRLDEPEDEFTVCQMLHNWKKAKTREATVGLLLKILWEAKEYDAAVYLSENL